MTFVLLGLIFIISGVVIIRKSINKRIACETYNKMFKEHHYLHIIALGIVITGLLIIIILTISQCLTNILVKI